MPFTPLPPGSIDVVAWYRYDIELRQTDVQQRQDNYTADAANLADYRVKYLAAMKANSDALAAGMNAVENFSEGELTRIFMSALAHDWGMSGRGVASITALAKQMAQALKAAYPTP